MDSPLRRAGLVLSSSLSRLLLGGDGLGDGDADFRLFHACIALTFQFVLAFAREAAVSESLIFSA
jgi:hypothetical protein